ncbi:DUF3006 domain-containing protein [Natronococcus pandeyae]|uniref:DUF3006 domain-containing protein n=1 Tax=Natronococcus pandeyae TaxID=2055836 RepID=A0A8J8TN28_9EURY|nr:DUF3006 domain-containing protein [Natronococcus pandeyae]TYL35858.1 DUF3006 domain-containing protein [Natronococcus pandeyae]
MNGEYTAVVDRIVDGQQAVLLIEDGDETIDEMVIDVDRLPQNATERAVLEVQIQNGSLTDMEYLPEQTEARLERVQKRFDRLSKPLSEEDS